MEKQNKKIDSNSTLGEALNHNGAGEILFKHGIPCLSCPMIAQEKNELTLGRVCEVYNLDLEKLLEDLNNLSVK